MGQMGQEKGNNGDERTWDITPQLTPFTVYVNVN